MKFVYADALDFVDPDYDFLKDESPVDRISHADDLYPHEYLATPPYDGILVSRAIVGDVKMTGKYRESQFMRFRREGGRSFLRYDSKKFPDSMLLGDNGAFSYKEMDVPPFGVADTVDFYGDGNFTHGCSVDHIILAYEGAVGTPRTETSREILDRYDLTLDLAADFFTQSKTLGKSFTPLGVIQGWSAASMAEAALKLEHMGYRYLAVGGLVPLKVEQIHEVLGAIRAAISSNVRLHLLGFGKIDSVHEFTDYGVESFDTTSPLLRAFKDDKKNYFVPGEARELDFYTAIRIPQSTDNEVLKRKAREGSIDQEDIRQLESNAMIAVRGYAEGMMDLETALDAILTYWNSLQWALKGKKTRESENKKLRETYAKTLSEKPWERCPCRVCVSVGVEALIFRSSNRNKRRGIHNLHVFYERLQERLQ